MSKSLTQWESYIGVALKKTAESTMETAKRIHAFKEDTNPEEFKKSMKDWFGFSATHITHWNKIHESMERFEDNVELLPGSTRTLYELSIIDDELWNELVASGDIKPSLTVESTKNLKLSGGVVKSLSAKYSDSPDYLEICRKLNELKHKTDSVVDMKKEFNTWIKANPPSTMDEESIDGEFEEIVEKVNIEPKSAKLNKIEAYARFGIHMDSTLTNLPILKLLHQLAEDDELLQEAIKEITRAQ